MTLFNFTLTRQSTNKVDWDALSPTTNQFIHNMITRGHLVGRKDGPGIIAATFKPRSRLVQKNIDLVTGLILDVDGKFNRIGADMPVGATLAEDGKHYHEVIPPDWLIAKLPYCGVAHSSYSHTPHLPKYRVIMPLAKPITPPEFLRLWFWIYTKVEHKADAACKNPDRMFFLPRCTQDAKDAGWPWMRPMFGPLLDISMVPEDYQIPEEFYYDTSRPEKKQGAHFAPPQTNFRPTDAHKLLETLLDLPVYSWAVESAEELKYLAWFGLAANIAAAVVDDPTAHQAGAQALHAISECDDTRYSHAATEKMWHEALKSADKPMKYATLKLNGVPDDVDDGGAKSPVAHARALLSQSERHQRPKDLASVSSLLVPGAEEALKAVQLMSGAMEPGEPAVTMPVVPPPAAQDVAVEPTEVLAASNQPDEPDEPREALIDTYKQTDVLYDMSRAGWILLGTDPDTGIKDWLMDKPVKDEAFNRRLMNMGLPRKGLDDWKVWVPVFNYRRCIYTTHQLLVVNGHETIYNTYRPSRLIPTAGSWDNIRELFLHLVSGDVAALEYTLDWYARPLQMIYRKQSPVNGAYKNGTSLVYRGDPGSGKNTAMDIVRLCFGATNCVTLGQEDLDGRFHSNLLDKLFVVGNEVMSSSNRSGQTANKLKSWVTDPLIPCEGKFADAGEAQNNFNIVFTSNDERPLLIEKGDRRYSVFQSTTIPKRIIDPVQSDLQGAKVQISAFYRMLLDRKVAMKYGEIYHTEARAQVQHASAPTSERFAAAIEDDGFLSVAAGWKESARTGENREEMVSFNGEFFITSDTLMAVYKHFCQNLGAHPQHIRALTQALHAVFPNVESNYRIRIGNVSRRAWRGIPLESPHASILPMPLKPADATSAVPAAEIAANASDMVFGDAPQNA